MKRPPIPRALLPHKAQLLTETIDAWQNATVTDSKNLKYIRIDADLTHRADEKDTVHAARWLLFYDCRNSLPRGVTFSVGQTVTWNDLRLTIKKITPVWEDRTLHHYELELEGG